MALNNISTPSKNHQASNGPSHGGNLQQAVEEYGIPRSDWLDISTGISPFIWPVPSIPQDVWQRLPEADGQLEHAAQQYYGTAALPVPGSQWAIQYLPTLFAKSRVWLAQESYEEYHHWWRHHGHSIQTFSALPEAGDLRDGDIVIVINPNNPTARNYPVHDLQLLAAQLQQTNGWLIVDEAFMDATPDNSLLPNTHPHQNIVVLRSMGKFFGLAGIRVGFVLGNANIRDALQAHLGPWSISHPAQLIAVDALNDSQWQKENRQRLHEQSVRLRELLQIAFPQEEISSTPLFASISLKYSRAEHWQHQLALRGIWIRSFPHWNRIRFGLPDNASWQRIELAVAEFA